LAASRQVTLPGGSERKGVFSWHHHSELPGVTGNKEMSQKSEIQAQITGIADEIEKIVGTDEEPNEVTEEQQQELNELNEQLDVLTTQLSELRAEEERANLRQVADDARKFATASERKTSPNKTGVRIGRIREAIEDDPQRGFKSFAHFATEVFDAGNTPRSNEKLMKVAAGTGMQQSITADGGVFVPPAFSRSIWDRVLVQSNSMLQYCDRIPVDMGVESVTVPAINETSRADGSRGGGIQGYWKSELTQLTSSKPTFREVKLTPQELYVFAYISDKLLRNAPGTASRVLEDQAASEISFKIGDAVVNGDGVGKPIGFVGHASTVSVAKETGQAAATVVRKNLTKMRNRMHPNWQGGAVWFVNPDVMVALEDMVIEVGTGGIPVYMPPGGLSESPYSMLYGKPVIPIEYCAALGTVGDIVYANLMAYATAIKGMVDSNYSMHLKFDFAQTAYRLIFEMDGQPWLNSAITAYKGSTTRSPIVTLATRS